MPIKINLKTNNNMETTLPKDDSELHEAFGTILTIESFSDYITDIAKLIYNSELCAENLKKILTDYKISKIEDIKEELLDLLIVYINIVLHDHVVTDHEKRNVEFLKKYFKIREGDFYKNRYDEVVYTLLRQFEKLYKDNLIDNYEANYSVNLQKMFDLSYDQFDELKGGEVRKALDRGVDITNLDTARYPKAPSVSNSDTSQSILQKVKDLVWKRDNGQCRECGSNQNLELIPIIPYSKGGTYTCRNVQLLCEPCKKRTNE